MMKWIMGILTAATAFILGMGGNLFGKIGQDAIVKTIAKRTLNQSSKASSLAVNQLKSHPALAGGNNLRNPNGNILFENIIEKGTFMFKYSFYAAVGSSTTNGWY